jgi:hypothetical protein
MPTRFLSRAELARLGAFPEAIDRDDLAEHFRLSGDDLEFVRAQRGAASQLGIALQLCALRWLGFIPEDLAGAPAAAVESLAVALDVPARAGSIMRSGRRRGASIGLLFARMHTPATFFVIGRWARQYPQLVATEARDGFEIGDHTATHPFLSLLSPVAQAAQITQAAADIRAAGGPRPRLFRPPHGSFDQATVQILRAQRLLMVLWSADTKDYARPGVAKIIYTAVSGAQPGAIILMHDGGGDRSQTAAALPRIILRLRQRGFRLVTVAQLVADDPPSSWQPSPRPLSGRG